MVKLLLVEDDPRILSFVKRGLEAEGYTVDVAQDGQAGLELARAASYPLIILDRMLPLLDGMEVCRALREGTCESLILMLTAKDSLQDKVHGLRAGADDYLTKPFAFDELIARLEALLRRRPAAPPEPMMRVDDLVLDTATKRASRAGRDIALTAREYALLAYLMSHPGKVVSRNRLLNNVWEVDFDPGTKVVEVQISYLRRKIDHEGEKPLIRTVRGFGYMISR